MTLLYAHVCMDIDVIWWYFVLKIEKTTKDYGRWLIIEGRICVQQVKETWNQCLPVKVYTSQTNNMKTKCSLGGQMYSNASRFPEVPLLLNDSCQISLSDKGFFSKGNPKPKPKP